MTFRRLLVLLEHLPRGSAFKRSVDPVGAEWGPLEYIAADQFDALSAANWQRANEGSKNPTPRPKPYPRPGDVAVGMSEQEKKIAALKAQRDRFRKQRAGGE